jgi:hypothetical protein
MGQFSMEEHLAITKLHKDYGHHHDFTFPFVTARLAVLVVCDMAGGTVYYTEKVI